MSLFSKTLAFLNQSVSNGKILNFLRELENKDEGFGEKMIVLEDQSFLGVNHQLSPKSLLIFILNIFCVTLFCRLSVAI
jgi:hypothetical protein